MAKDRAMQMTREEVKAALKSYRAIKREHDDLVRRREEIEASILGSPRLDGMPHGAGVSNPTANIGAALAELSTLYDGKARQLAAAMILVEDMIDHLTDPTQRMVARLYYIDGLTWEQVCVAANYSWRQTHRIHAALLDELSDKEPTQIVTTMYGLDGQIITEHVETVQDGTERRERND